MHTFRFLEKTLKDNFLLIVIIVCHIAFFLLFQFLNKAPQTWDSAGHIGLSFRFADELGLFFSEPSWTKFVDILRLSNYYPPFILLLGAFFSLLFGYSSKYILAITLFFFILLMVYEYKLVLKLFQNKSLAIKSVLFLSLFPILLEQSHVFQLDLPLVALLLCAYYYLFVSDGFTKSYETVVFFILFAFAQITKWYAVVYMFVPFMYTASIFLKRLNKAPKKYYLLNLLPPILFGILLFLIVTLPWYVANYVDLLKFSKMFSTPENDDPVGIFTLANMFFYPISALTYMTLFVPMLLIAIGLVTMFVKDKKQFLFVLMFIALPTALFTFFIANKNLRYILPLVPMLSYLISYTLMQFAIKAKYLFHITLLYFVSAVLFLTFNQFKANQPLLLPISVLFAGPNYNAWYKVDPTFYAVDKNEYPVNEVLDFIVNDAAREPSIPLGIANLSDSQKFSAATLEMVRLEKHLRNVYLPVPYFQYEQFGSRAAMDEFLLSTNAEYVIVPDWPGPEGLRNFSALKQMGDYFLSGSNPRYLKLREFDFPLGQKIYIFKRLDLAKKFVFPGECSNMAGYADGIESIKLVPNTSYIIFTGHFAIQDKIWRDYSKGTLYIVQIENTVHQSILDVHNMPRSGSTICARSGLNLDILNEVKLPLIENGRCGDGIDCQKVLLVKWSVGSPDFDIKEFTRGDFK